jgi:stage II sporulation protein D
MPAFWPKEALKAQAVAARTYAVGNVLSSKFDDYHLESDVKSQMYTGISRETKFSSQAVQDTKGEILVSNNQIVQAYYHSNSGGITETPDMVWGSKLDYLVSVKSDFCKKADTYEWKAVLDKKFIEKKLESLGLGEIQEISIKEFTPTGRVKTLEIKGTESTREIKGQDFRMNLSPMKIRSLLFTIKKENDQFLLEGNGFGHGVGMSQWGALNMARANHEYKEILYYYYKNVELVALPN